MSNINCAALNCLTKINVFSGNVLPTAVRGASREAGASLEQKSQPENKNKNKNKNKKKNKNKNKNKNKTKNKNKNKNKTLFSGTTSLLTFSCF